MKLPEDKIVWINQKIADSINEQMATKPFDELVEAGVAVFERASA